MTLLYENMQHDKALDDKSLDSLNSLDRTSLNDKKAHFFVLCNHSICRKELYFHNYVDRKDASTLIISKIIDVLKLDGKSIDYSLIPIEMVNERDAAIDINSRMKQIISMYNYTIAEGKGMPLIKCSPKTYLEHKGKGDTLRFIVDCKNNEWIVVLIDPWHMFATSRSKENFIKYKNKQVYDIKDLKLK